MGETSRGKWRVRKGRKKWRQHGRLILKKRLPRKRERSL